MMHIKLFEEIGNTPEVGDYVICNSEYAEKKNSKIFFNTCW
jgi:hypothetical protein